MIFRTSRLCLLILAFCLAAIAASAQTGAAVRAYEKPVAPGVVLLERVDPSTPLVFTGIKVDPRQAGVRVGAFVANNFINSKRRETVGSAVARTRAVAGANGDFFPWTSDPLGLTVVDGRLVSEPWVDRPAVGFFPGNRAMLGCVRMALTFEFPNGRLLKANGVDRPLAAGELVVYERAWGTSTGARENSAELLLECDWGALTEQGTVSARVQKVVSPAQNTPIGREDVVLVAEGPRVRELTDAASGAEGGVVKVKLILQDDDQRSWIGVRDACGGGSWLIKDGTVTEKENGDGFSDSFRTVRHPRTAAGVTRNGYVLIAVVDGRQITSRGASLPELAAVMQNQGCTDAINLDGGGSSTLVVGDVVINSPSDGQQRTVASGLLVYAPEPAAASPTFTLEPANPTVGAGTSTQFKVSPAGGATAALSNVIWGTRNGGGFMEQNGVFRALRKGSHAVAARIGLSSASTSVTVVAGTPGSISAAWDASTPAGSSSRKLTFTVKDGLGNVSPNADVTLTVTGGTADPATVRCGPDGVGTAVITWDAASAPDARVVEMKTNGASARLANE